MPTTISDIPDDIVEEIFNLVQCPRSLFLLYPVLKRSSVEPVLAKMIADSEVRVSTIGDSSGSVSISEISEVPQCRVVYKRNVSGFDRYPGTVMCLRTLPTLLSHCPTNVVEMDLGDEDFTFDQIEPFCSLVLLIGGDCGELDEDTPLPPLLKCLKLECDVSGVPSQLEELHVLAYQLLCWHLPNLKRLTVEAEYGLVTIDAPKLQYLDYSFSKSYNNIVDVNLRTPSLCHLRVYAPPLKDLGYHIELGHAQCRFSGFRQMSLSLVEVINLEDVDMFRGVKFLQTRMVQLGHIQDAVLNGDHINVTGVKNCHITGEKVSMAQAAGGSISCETLISRQGPLPDNVTTNDLTLVGWSTAIRGHKVSSLNVQQIKFVGCEFLSDRDHPVYLSKTVRRLEVIGEDTGEIWFQPRGNLKDLEVVTALKVRLKDWYD